MAGTPAPADVRCCASIDLQWTQRVVDGQYADVNFCASCGHVHRTEKYQVSLRFPYSDRCINCGGDLVLLTEVGPYETPDPTQIRCTDCGLTDSANRALHERLAAIHPDARFLSASQALVDSGRYVLALKLATAEVRYGEDPVAGEVQRLAVLEAMNEYDRALDEAYEWSEREGCPTLVWGVIAELEAGSGNVGGALTALERGLSFEPDNAEWWLDYAEVNLHLDDRPNAVRAAGKALPDIRNEERAIAVLSEVAERYYAAGMYAEALSACSIANERQERYASIAWLRARISAVNQDTNYLVKWLEITVALDPGHAEAKEMLEPYKKRKGWFSW
ncbi:MAG: tetratricopeptide repeat protein [Myxococcota bacterium]